MGRLFLRWLSTGLDHITITGPLSKDTESQGSPEWLCSVDMGLRTTRNWQSLPQARLRLGKAFLSTTVAAASTILEITPALHQRVHLHSTRDHTSTIRDHTSTPPESTPTRHHRSHLHNIRDHTSTPPGITPPQCKRSHLYSIRDHTSAPSESTPPLHQRTHSPLAPSFPVYRCLSCLHSQAAPSQLSKSPAAGLNKCKHSIMR